MCSSYKGFGRFSIAIGIVFAVAGIFYGFNQIRVAVVAFFLLLGALDLALYSKYGEG